MLLEILRLHSVIDYEDLETENAAEHIKSILDFLQIKYKSKRTCVYKSRFIIQTEMNLQSGFTRNILKKRPIFGI